MVLELVLVWVVRVSGASVGYSSHSYARGNTPCFGFTGLAKNLSPPTPIPKPQNPNRQTAFWWCEAPRATRARARDAARTGAPGVVHPERMVRKRKAPVHFTVARFPFDEVGTKTIQEIGKDADDHIVYALTHNDDRSHVRLLQFTGDAKEATLLLQQETDTEHAAQSARSVANCRSSGWRLQRGQRANGARVCFIYVYDGEAKKDHRVATHVVFKDAHDANTPTWLSTDERMLQNPTDELFVRINAYDKTFRLCEADGTFKTFKCWQKPAEETSTSTSEETPAPAGLLSLSGTPLRSTNQASLRRSHRFDSPSPPADTSSTSPGSATIDSSDQSEGTRKSLRIAGALAREDMSPGSARALLDELPADGTDPLQFLTNPGSPPPPWSPGLFFK